MELAGKARDGKLGAKDMSGATFTISSIGVLGTTAFTPIINMPEVAIMGVSKLLLNRFGMVKSLFLGLCYLYLCQQIIEL